MKLWIDDIRRPPSHEYQWCMSVDEAKSYIELMVNAYPDDLVLIDLDHDAGDWVYQGGDYIKLLDWLETIGYVNDNWSFRIHSMNPVGRQNMRLIIEKNGWRERSDETN